LIVSTTRDNTELLVQLKNKSAEQEMAVAVTVPATIAYQGERPT
jgi:hypothetical protein